MDKKSFLVSILMLVVLAACAVPSPTPTMQSTQAALPTSTPHPTVVRQQTAETNAVRGGNLIIGIVNEASTLQPLLAADSPSQTYINLFYAPLVRVDPQTLGNHRRALRGQTDDSRRWNQDYMETAARVKVE